MYLVVGDQNDRSLKTLLWGWASGKKEYRDMTAYMVEKLGPNIYCYKEDEAVRLALQSNQARYGRDESGRFKLRVMRIDLADADLTTVAGDSGSHLTPTEIGVMRIVGDVVSRLMQVSGLNIDFDGGESKGIDSSGSAKGKYGFRSQTQVEEDEVLQAHSDIMTPIIIKRLIKYYNPTMKDIEDVAYTLNLYPGWVKTIYQLAKIDPGIFATLRKLGYSEEQIPSWVARPTIKNKPEP